MLPNTVNKKLGNDARTIKISNEKTWMIRAFEGFNPEKIGQPMNSKTTNQREYKSSMERMMIR